MMLSNDLVKGSHVSMLWALTMMILPREKTRSHIGRIHSYGTVHVTCNKYGVTVWDMRYTSIKFSPKLMSLIQSCSGPIIHEIVATQKITSPLSVMYANMYETTWKQGNATNLRFHDAGSPKKDEDAVSPISWCP